MRTVRCITPECPSKGLVRTVADRRSGPGVVYRPELICADCEEPLVEHGRDPREEKAVRQPPETTARRTKATTKRAR